MKKLIRKFNEELEEENFSYHEYVIYGIIYPTSIVAACIFASLLA